MVMLSRKAMMGQRGVTRPVTLEEHILALPGVKAYWPHTETSGLEAKNAIGNTALNASYAGGIPLAATPFPVGDPVVRFNGSSNEIVYPEAEIATAWSWEKGWFLAFVIQDDDQQIDAVRQYKAYINGGGGGTALEIVSDDRTTPRMNYMRCVAPTLINHSYALNHTAGECFMFVWDSAEDVMRLYYQGVPMKQGALGSPPPFAGAFDLGKISGFRGGIGHVAFGASVVPTDEQIDSLFRTVYPATYSIFACGDSKATDNDCWIDFTVGNLITAGPNMWREYPYRVGLSGQRTWQLHAYLDASLASMAGNPTYCLVNVGANDIPQIASAALTENDYKTEMRGVIEALHTRWPSAQIYWTHPWRGDGDYNAAATTLKGWNQGVLAEFAYAHEGSDETEWFKTGIETYSDDDIHPNNAGHIEAAAQCVAILTA